MTDTIKTTLGSKHNRYKWHPVRVGRSRAAGFPSLQTERERGGGRESSIMPLLYFLSWGQHPNGHINNTLHVWGSLWRLECWLRWRGVGLGGGSVGFILPLGYRLQSLEGFFNVNYKQDNTCNYLWSSVASRRNLWLLGACINAKQVYTFTLQTLKSKQMFVLFSIGKWSD